MKRINGVLAALALMLVAGACKDGYIDDITSVPPGEDTAAPEVAITYPLQGTLIRVAEDVTAIKIQLTVTDDIEISNITLKLDGNEIGKFDNFADYRKAVKEVTYDKLTNGDHTLEVTATDLSGKSTSKSVNFRKVEPYKPVYAGEVFYMPFDGDNMELVSVTNATRVGNPGFSTSGKSGSAYLGATGAYLTLPTTGLTNPEFTAVMWYKLNAAPDRAGILTASPTGPTNNNRTGGFRLFRENAGGKQRIKLNVGNGTTDSWFDGGAAADIAPGSDWVHLAFTISGSKCVVYINGKVVSQGNFTGVSWAGCDVLSIGSGAPRFTEWSHLSDLSLIDELRIFKKELSQAEIQAIINAK